MLLSRRLFLPVGAGLLLIGLGGCQSAPSVEELRQLSSLDHTLQALNSRRARQDSATLANIEYAVESSHWQRQDVAVLHQADSVQARTRELTRYIGQLRRRLLAAAGPAALDARQPVATVLLGDAPGRCAADTLQQQLNAFARYVRQWVPEQDSLVAPDADADPRLQESGKNPLGGWRFAQVQFQDASTAAALTMLTRQQADVLALARQALGKLSQRVGYGDVFERIGAFAIPQTNTVRAGDTYRATLMLTSSATGLRPDMRANGKPVPVLPNGRGQVVFQVPADAPAGPAFWEASATVKYQRRDSTFRLRVPYTVLPK